MDTVPPFINSSEDGDRIYGRGACDAKGLSPLRFWRRRSCASQAFSSACCFWSVKSETRSARKRPTSSPIGARFMINGEPTENKLALASKGALHVELVARGKMAHSHTPNWRVCHRQTGGSAAPAARDEAPRKCRCRSLHEECRLHSGRTRAQCDPRLRQSRSLLSPGGSGRRAGAATLQKLSATSSKFISPANPVPAAAHDRRPAHHGRRLHHRHPLAAEIGANRCCWAPARSTWRTPRASSWKGATSGGVKIYCSMAKRLSS